MRSDRGIKSVENFRDMGGIPVAGGRIRRGMLYRSAQLGTASQKDTERFMQLGIAHVFDFRDASEAQRCPDVIIGGARYHSVPANPPKDAAFAALDNRSWSQIKHITKKEAEMYERLFADLYASSSFGNPAFRAVFDALGEDSPLLFHCVEGKDRTGAMASLLLLALGADRKAIVRDYLLTNRFYAKKNTAAALRALLQTGNIYAVRELKAFTVAHRRNIDSILDAIEKRYASCADFFLHEYGVSAEQLAEWRRVYVEPKRH